MWSTALDTVLTTLRYLAPATLLTLFWGQESFLFKLLKYIDTAFRAIVFSSEEQNQKVLKWLTEAGPVQVEHLETVWRHGWIVCGVLDAALPGVCAGHPPTRFSLRHAQAIAENYLGVEPIFSREELESNNSLSRYQEWKLATYLDRIREALSKLNTQVSKSTSQRTSQETINFTLDYVAKGSGLKAAQVNNKMYFKIYPTSQQSLDPGEITVFIKGPRNAYGMTVLPPVLGKAQRIRQKLLGLQSKSHYTENALPITQGATYLRAYGKHDMTKTYYIPKMKYEIEIQEEIRKDHIKVGYIVTLEGNYEISIVSRDQNIVGSPFTMKSSKNIYDTLESESSCLEDGEEINIVDVKTDRKVVLRIVDFVTEKMLLKENGTLKKISDDEATSLMTTDSLSEDTEISYFTSTNDNEILGKSRKFFKVVNKIIEMNRVCKAFRKTTIKSHKAATKNGSCYSRPRSQQDIPDIVNSTFWETKSNPFILSDTRDQVIIPESISVTLRTEKSKLFREDLKSGINDPVQKNQVKSNIPDNFQSFESLPEQTEDRAMSRAHSSSNPFLNNIYEQDFEKDLGTFGKTEYETNNSQSEETEDTTIKIVVGAADGNKPSQICNNNPFIELDIINMERPKTPVLKIITGEITDTSVYVDPRVTPEQLYANEFTNPFFLLHHQTDQEALPVTDFIIGAPVSLPPIIRSQTPEPLKESLTGNTIQANNVSKDISAFSNPVIAQSNKSKMCKENSKDSQPSPTFHSSDSNVDIVNISNSNINLEAEVIQSDRNITPKKDLWDSAYVSIDENNPCPDSNNNDNNLSYCSHTKQKLSLNEHEEFTKMGPAEREIWKTSLDIYNVAKSNEDDKSRWDVKRSTFTPIIEENDRRISKQSKYISRSEQPVKLLDTDSVKVAFIELKEIKEPDGNTNKTDGENVNKDLEINTNREKRVNSASAKSDVMRHVKHVEGKISEVQANVTESVSVSQVLQIKKQSHLCTDLMKNETQFGDQTNTNIVLEKKQYWDEKIRQIQAKEAEDSIPKKRKLSARHLRQNDSLTKQRGKQLAKTYIKDNHNKTLLSKPTEEIKIINRLSPISAETANTVETDVKLVQKWKKYWDTKLESEKEEVDILCLRTKSTKSRSNSMSPHQLKSSDDEIDITRNVSTSTVKQELPEEVFKAFETSPKRFFGTSRKRILNKIDTFLGKPSTADKSSADESGAIPDTGLVSSRILMYHNISKTEQLPLSRRKFQSMHNIFQKRESERNNSIDENIKTKYLVRAASLVLNNPNITDVTNTKDVISQIEAPNYEAKQSVNISLKRARFAQEACTSTFDEANQKAIQDQETAKPNNSINNSINQYNKKSHTTIPQRFKPNTLCQSSISKSETDIFSKVILKRPDNDLDMYKSCDELPEPNVKNFISLYESVSKPDLKAPLINTSKTSLDGHKNLKSSSSLGAENKTDSLSTHYKFQISKSERQNDNENKTDHFRPLSFWEQQNQKSGSMKTSGSKSFDFIEVEKNSPEKATKTFGSLDNNHTSSEEATYVSLSDIEVEIVDKFEDLTLLKSDKDSDYKSRFKFAKQFFKSLEELNDEVKPKKPNECELLLMNTSTESLENDRPQKRHRKKNIKTHSIPPSERSKILNRFHGTNPSQLVKVSEKFNIDDLFNDVMKGKLSRQGSLRGIPNKKAVLETFRSMENLTGPKMSSYEIAISQLNDFAKEDRKENVQTYLTEYPYLPKTDPSKYHSRLDAEASGLISLKELQNLKPRRNSVPDFWLNTKKHDL